MKKIILTVFTLLLMLALNPIQQTIEINNNNNDKLTTAFSGASIASASVLKDPPKEEITLEVIKIERSEPKNLDEANTLLNNSIIRAAHAETLLNSLTALGYLNDHPAVILAYTELANTEADVIYYTEIYNKLQEAQKWENRKNEYPVATEIWLYLKKLGYNDWVCAGIMGNIMSEVGGQTLNIQYKLYSNDRYYYGMCQWSASYKEIWDAELTEQCNFLANTIQYEIDTFGYIYQNGFTYNDFLNLTDEKSAALAFAKTYERCGSESHFIRQENATIAYEYFTG